MKTIFIVLFFISTIFAKINIVSSTTDLADIAKTIGGNRVKVSSISNGKQDHHYVEILPSYMIKVKKADIYLKVGLELDIWANQIIDGSRNSNLIVINCAQNIQPLEIPTTKIDASMGDIHSMGNPHYWLDPNNGKIIAENISKALVTVDPEGHDFYENNYINFVNSINESLSKWLGVYAHLRNKKMVFYHNSWPYFNNRFGLEAIQFIEPKPGIMPSPAHLKKLLQIIKSNDIEIIGLETYFSDKAPQFLSTKTDIKIIRLAQSVNALPGTETYLKMIEYNLNIISNTFGVDND